MSVTINWTTNVQVAGGPMFTLAGELAGENDVTAYEVIDVSIGHGASADVTIGSSGTDLVFLLVKSSKYGSLLQYTVNPPPLTTPPSAIIPVMHKLDVPLILIGPGAAALLAATVNHIQFDNGMSEAVDIQLLIGRKAH